MQHCCGLGAQFYDSELRLVLQVHLFILYLDLVLKPVLIAVIALQL